MEFLEMMLENIANIAIRFLSLSAWESSYGQESWAFINT